MQKLVKVPGTTILSKKFYMRSGLKTPVNILESLCVWVCPMFEKTISKYVEVNHERIHT